MTNLKVSDLSDGGALQAGDKLYAERAGSQVSIDGSAVGGSQTSLPVAIPADATIDSTTYDDPFGGPGKIVVLVYTVNEIATAMALQGDAFPRVCLLSDITDGWYFGDGTYNPYDDGPEIALSGHALQIAGGGGFGGVIAIGDDPGPNRFSGQVRVQSGLLLNTVRLNAGGDPNGFVGGEVGDYHFRSDTPTTSNQRIYICTTAGDPTTAVWTGIV